jgi:hypothetical protein
MLAIAARAFELRRLGKGALMTVDRRLVAQGRDDLGLVEDSPGAPELHELIREQVSDRPR